MWRPNAVHSRSLVVRKRSKIGCLQANVEPELAEDIGDQGSHEGNHHARLDPVEKVCRPAGDAAAMSFGEDGELGPADFHRRVQGAGKDSF
jgi:hypothetical protein